MSSVNLLQGDCLELMKNIPDESIDMILADLPYGVTNHKWDSIISFELLWKEYNRIIEPKGAIVLFSSGKFTNTLINSQSNLYRYKWIWEKNRSGNFVNSHNRPMTRYEEICVFSKGITVNSKKNGSKKMNYYPQGLISVNRINSSGRSQFNPYQNERHAWFQKYTNYPNDILKFDCVQKPEHPTQKPVALLEYLIKTYTREGETVLDNTMGAGSTGVACVNINRNFIGMELDENYFKIAEKRINDAKH